MIHIRFVVDEKRCDVVIAVVDRKFQRTLPVGGDRIHVRARGHQSPRGFHVTLPHGEMQRSEPAVIVFLGLFTGLRIARKAGHTGIGCRTATASLGRDNLRTNIDIRAALDEQLRGIGMALGNSPH